MSLFGIFAINPTLSTIITLKKQLADSQLVHEKLSTKISNLSSLQQQYSQLTPDLPVVFDAIPQTAQAPGLMGQVFALSKNMNVQITSLEITNAQLTGGKAQDEASYPFSLNARGSYEDLINFAKSLTKINRILSIDSMSISKDAKLNTIELDIQGQGYFKK